MRVLVTGTDGYIGSVMTPYLIERGHDVVGLDTGFYRAGWLFDDRRSQPFDDHQGHPGRPAGGSARASTPSCILPNLSNDPLGEHNVEITYDINFQRVDERRTSGKGRRRQAVRLCLILQHLRRRFERCPHGGIRAQSADGLCGMQGALRAGHVASSPTTAFSPTFMRNATAFGASPRMRFDIVLNNLAGLAWTTKKIEMTSDGTPWRPLVHVLDICQSVDLTLRAPVEKVRGEIVQRRRRRAELSRSRDRRDRRQQAFPGCAYPSARRAPTTAATASPLPRSASTCRISNAGGPRSAAPSSSRGCSSGSR